MASISSTMGTVADGNDIGWKAWYDAGLLSCLEAAPIVRTGQGALTYYFSNSDGDDLNDGLTPATPFKTMTKLAQIITSVEEADPQPSAMFLLKRGDVWREGLNWATAYAEATEVVSLNDLQNCTIGAYGDIGKPRPLVTTFVHVAEPFTLDASGDSYYLDWDEARYGPVGWLKNLDYDAENQKPMHSDTDADQATLETLDLDDIPQGGFFYNTTSDRLYVRISDGSGNLIDPTGRIEVAPLNEIKFIDSDDADGNRIDSLHLEGWGCFGDGQNYAIMLQSSSGNFNVVSNCKVGYSGKHAIGMYSHTSVYTTGSGSGLVCVDCEAYGCKDGSPAVAFAETGSHQCLYHNCGCTWDVYPEQVTIEYPDFNAGGHGKKRGWYAHTGSNNMALAIAYGCWCPRGNRYNPFETVAFANQPAASSDISNCKVFIANCFGEHYALKWQKGCNSLIAPNQVSMNNHFIFHQLGATNSNQSMICQSNGTAAAWSFNNIFEHHITGEIASPSNNTRMSFFNMATTTPNLFVNCHFRIRIAAGLNNDTALFADNDNDAAEVVRCIFDFQCDGDAWTGAGDTSTLIGNAVLDSMDYDESTGWQDDMSADDDLVELTAVPTLKRKPDARGQLYQVAVEGSPTIVPNYDMRWRSRPTNASIGPIEHHTAAVRMARTA